MPPRRADASASTVNDAISVRTETTVASDTGCPAARVARAAFLSGLTAWTLFAPSGVMLAGTPGTVRAAETVAQADPELAERVRHHWDDVRTALRRGDYASARRSLDLIRELTPEDPDLPLYHLLLRARDESSSPFTQVTPDRLAALKRQLDEEERAQRKHAVQLKALDRQVMKEQATWDQESKRLQHARPPGPPTTQAGAGGEERQRRAGEAEQDAKRKPRERQVIRTSPAVVPEGERPTPTQSAPAAPTEVTPSPRPAIPSSPATPGSVQLAPVTVETPADDAASPATGEEGWPTLTAARVRPPAGAVQIHANQMSVSPNRKIAVAEGNVEVSFENAVLTCDRATLFTDTKDVYAEGRVRLEEGTQVFRGELVHYNLDTKKGRFLQGTVSTPPWYQHGRSIEHIAEGVYQVTPGYIPSCELEPPHFRFAGRRVTVFADDKLARAQNVALFVEQVPFLYLPWLSVADGKSPFFLIPGKRKPWGEFALMGYRYELSEFLGLTQKGTAKLDWRRHFGWGVGTDHELQSDQFGKGLLKLYYNDLKNRQKPNDSLPKGANGQRYRVLWRHRWQPMPDTTVITDFQKYSDEDFRKEFLFREEFTNDDAPESFISMVTNDPNYTLTGLVRKRVNRFQTMDEALPEVTFDVRQQRIGDTQLFSESRLDVANFQRKRAHSELDDDVIRVDWFQQLSYALSLFRPVLVTPKAGIRQTYYTKDIQSGTVDRQQGDRNVFSGQANVGGDASLKLFRIFPVVTNALGLNLNLLRHVLTPTVSYAYVHRPTVDNSLLNFAAASGPTNQLTFGLENKLQTRHLKGKRWEGVDLGRFLISVPYTFHGSGNKSGGEIGNWSFDLETYPWPWMRLESDWNVLGGPFNPATTDIRANQWNFDLVLVGGQGVLDAQHAQEISAPVAPSMRAFEPGPQSGISFLPEGQWYLGLGHRYSENDKTEDVVELDWRVTPKWQIGTFHRFDWKEVVGSSKRFNTLREYQYTLRRDLHDWVAELVYRVDRDFGEELFFTLTLKAFPEMPIDTKTAYHQPKLGSQSSPFWRH